MTKPAEPRRGEIWLVNFDPAKGAEIQKTRPAVVMSVDAVGRLPLRILVPVTDWKPQYAGYPWFVHLAANDTNGLSKDSGADGFQVKSVSEDRLTQKVGVLSDAQVAGIVAAIALCIGYSP